MADDGNISFESIDPEDDCDLENLLKEEEAEFSQNYVTIKSQNPKEINRRECQVDLSELNLRTIEVEMDTNYESPKRVESSKPERIERMRTMKEFSRKKKSVTRTHPLRKRQNKNETMKRKKRKSLYSCPTRVKIARIRVIRDAPYLHKNKRKKKRKKKKKKTSKKKIVTEKDFRNQQMKFVLEESNSQHLRSQSSRFIKQIQELRSQNQTLRSTLDSIKKEGHIQKILAMEESYKQYSKRNVRELEIVKEECRYFREENAALKTQGVNYQKIIEKERKSYETKIKRLNHHNSVLQKENDKFRVRLSVKNSEIKELKIKILEVKNHNKVLSKLLKEKRIYEQGRGGFHGME